MPTDLPPTPDQPTDPAKPKAASLFPILIVMGAGSLLMSVCGQILNVRRDADAERRHRELIESQREASRDFIRAVQIEWQRAPK